MTNQKDRVWRTPCDRNPQASDSADLWVLLILQAVVLSQNLHRLARLQGSAQDSTKRMELHAVICAVHLGGVAHQWTLRKNKRIWLFCVYILGLLEVDTFLFAKTICPILKCPPKKVMWRNNSLREENKTFCFGHSEMPEPKPVIKMIGCYDLEMSDILSLPDICYWSLANIVQFANFIAFCVHALNRNCNLLHLINEPPLHLCQFPQKWQICSLEHMG